ncbi:hypothetical protein [Kitasatospora sp. CB01950]|uniref:hypothetical protein n=1 Tax=Kitasatospora sp. CB01950 TaxID=1703930 RepID=UPI00094027A3|nr:hypothetical protein [Kitasatospora sp. CB01950]OKI95076.1 hypothetical protein AMK19_32920 [Kitasatospora sp. CB01950]
MSQTATAQSPSAAAQDQGTHHYVLTLQKPLPSGGFMVATSSGTCSPIGMSRYDIYTWLVGEMVRQTPQLADASTLLFDLQPNQL